MTLAWRAWQDEGFASLWRNHLERAPSNWHHGENRIHENGAKNAAECFPSLDQQRPMTLAQAVFLALPEKAS